MERIPSDVPCPAWSRLRPMTPARKKTVTKTFSYCGIAAICPKETAANATRQPTHWKSVWKREVSARGQQGLERAESV